MKTMASEEELKAEIERLRAENESLKKPARGQMSPDTCRASVAIWLT
jgi:hypothetical protein